MTNRTPEPAYPAKDVAILYGDKELYARIGKVAEQDGGKELVESFEIPIRSGKAWVVKKGELVIVLIARAVELCYEKQLNGTSYNLSRRRIV
jgi:hypothetical protein